MMGADEVAGIAVVVAIAIWITAVLYINCV